MIKENERPIRTDNKDMLLCTIEDKPNGQKDIVVRNGKKEDRMSPATFLAKVYGRPVAIMFI